MLTIYLAFWLGFIRSTFSGSESNIHSQHLYEGKISFVFYYFNDGVCFISFQFENVITAINKFLKKIEGKYTSYIHAEKTCIA